MTPILTGSLVRTSSVAAAESAVFGEVLLHYIGPFGKFEPYLWGNQFCSGDQCCPGAPSRGQTWRDQPCLLRRRGRAGVGSCSGPGGSEGRPTLRRRGAIP